MARPTKNYCDYFPHDRDMRNHRKIKAIRNKFGITGYALWNMIIEYLTGIDGNVFEFSDSEMELMSGDFGVSVTEITDMIYYCIKIDLLYLKDGFINSDSLDENLSPVYEKRKVSKSLSKKQLRINGKFASNNAVANGVSVTEKPQSKVEYSIVNNKEINKEVFCEIDNGTWGSEKARFLKSDQWQYNLCSKYGIKKDFLMERINFFLEKLELREDFKSEKELKRHFPNWFEKNRNPATTNGRVLSPYEQEVLDRRNSFKPIQE